MLKKLRYRIKGQSTAEYAILIALVVAAVIAMQTYAKRALQGKVRDASLYLVDQTSNMGNTIQYEPYYLHSEFQTTRDSATNVILDNQVSGQNSTINVERAVNGFQEFKFDVNDITNNQL